MKRCLAGALASLVFTMPLVAAQPAPLVFEVASIRENRIGGPGKKVGDPLTPVGTGGVMTPQGDRWTARNATVRTLIRFAYGSDGDLSTPALLEEYRLVGGPGWTATEAYDILATMPATPRAGFMGLMVAPRWLLVRALSPRVVRAVVDGYYGCNTHR